jgi:hypothetical protein
MSHPVVQAVCVAALLVFIYFAFGPILAGIVLVATVTGLVIGRYRRPSGGSRPRSP